MSGIEFAGSIISFISRLAVVVEDVGFVTSLSWSIYSAWSQRPTWENIRKQRLKSEYGRFWTWVLLRSGKALAVMERVERHVLPAAGGSEAIILKDSFSSSFNMVAVAGAIVAQVAITALSLPDLSRTHGVAQVFLIASLILGALCVFFSCLVQQIINSLHTSDEIKDWLSKPSSSEREHLFQHIHSIERIIYPSDPETASRDSYGELQLHLDQLLSTYRWKVASFSSAMMLVAPAVLLDLALNAFIIGLGIYLGWVYKENLSLVPNSKGAIAVFITYFITTFYGLSLFYVPSALKDLESRPTKKLARLMHDLRAHQEKANEPSTSQEGADPGNQQPPIAETSIPLTQIPPQSVHGAEEMSSAPVTRQDHQPRSSHVPEASHQDTSPSIPGASRPSPASTDLFLSSLEALVQAQERSFQVSQALLDEYRKTKPV